MCGLVVQNSDYAVECDKCKLWVHTHCNKITNKTYFTWDSNKYFECKKCNSCKICDRIVAKNHKALECTLCSRWIHIKCNRLTPKDYDKFLNDPSEIFFCIDCCNTLFPFNTLTDTQQQLTSKGIDYPDDLDINNLIKNEFEHITKKVNNAMLTLRTCTDDAEFEVNDCKYYSIDQFKSLKIKSDKKMSFCHLNIHSICAHIDELRMALTLLDHQFDFICISESKIRDGIEPRVDISIDGYQNPEGMSTSASKGGVLVYVNPIPGGAS